jgi:hypothetical protein
VLTVFQHDEFAGYGDAWPFDQRSIHLAEFELDNQVSFYRRSFSSGYLATSGSPGQVSLGDAVVDEELGDHLRAHRAQRQPSAQCIPCLPHAPRHRP